MSVTLDGLPRLTNLSVFWPDEGYTKLDLLTYYQQVAPFMLPFLVNRAQACAGDPTARRATSFISSSAAHRRSGFLGGVADSYTGEEHLTSHVRRVSAAQIAKINQLMAAQEASTLGDR